MPEVWIITGGRNYKNRSKVESFLLDVDPETIIRHGACKTGVDSFAENFWHDVLKRETDPHPADWNGKCIVGFCKPGHRRRRGGGSTYCLAAGNWRNKLMAEMEPKASRCVAFRGGSGTHDMMQCARNNHIGLQTIGFDDLTIF